MKSCRIQGELVCLLTSSVKSPCYAERSELVRCPAYITATIIKYQSRARVPMTISCLWVSGSGLREATWGHREVIGWLWEVTLGLREVTWGLREGTWGLRGVARGLTEATCIPGGSKKSFEGLGKSLRDLLR